MKFVILALCIAAVVADPHWVVLDETEAALVKNSWHKVYHNEVDILYYIFKQHPDIQAKFSAFAGKELDSLKDTAKFAVHAGRIVGFFSEYIDLLGQENTQAAIKTVLNELGHVHKDRGVTKAQFNEFRSSVLGYLKEHVSWGDNVEHAWNDAFDKAYYVIFSNLDGHAVH